VAASVSSHLAAVLVDIGDTLWPGGWPDPNRVHEERRRKLLAGVPGIEPVVDRFMDELHGWEAELEHSLEQDTYGDIQHMAATFGLPDDRETAFAIRRAMTVTIPEFVPLFAGAKELLATIKDVGLRCVMVTNTHWGDNADRWSDLEIYGLSPYVDGVVTSLDAQSRKPEPKMFRDALALARCEPERAVFMGNSEFHDIEPAKVMGMRTILAAIVTLAPERTRADAVVTSLDEAAAVLRRWMAETSAAQ
jgi:FMN phosphatase YigB (HAD superfamily)